MRRSVSGHPPWLLFGFWAGIVISIAVVIRRLNALIHPTAISGRPPQMAAMDASFGAHAVLTAVHIIPALLFVLLAVGILFGGLRKEWIERLFLTLGAITGITAYAMSSYAIGGSLERSAVLVFNSWFLFSLWRAKQFRVRHERARMREWIARAVGVLLGIATTRPVMGIFFATSGLTHLTPGQFFGVAFWIGFSINVIVIELWLHSEKRVQIHSEGSI